MKTPARGMSKGLPLQQQQRQQQQPHPRKPPQWRLPAAGQATGREPMSCSGIPRDSWMQAPCSWRQGSFTSTCPGRRAVHVQQLPGWRYMYLTGCLHAMASPSGVQR